jgi:hypothetical protein
MYRLHKLRKALPFVRSLAKLFGIAGLMWWFPACCALSAKHSLVGSGERWEWLESLDIGFNTLGSTCGSSIGVMGSGCFSSLATSCAISVARFLRLDSSWLIHSESDGIVVTKRLLFLVKEKWRDNGWAVQSREEDLWRFQEHCSLANWLGHPTILSPSKRRVFFCKGNLMIRAKSPILARKSQRMRFVN